MISQTINRTVLGLALAALTGGLYPASAAVGAWSDGAKASARLIAEGVDRDGNLAAGIEIILPPGWKPYCRTPGDAGIAPVIDFSASVNVGAAHIYFPTPHRFDDGYSVTNVYEDRVVLLASLPVVDRQSPIELVVSMKLGVCEIVCIPESFDLVLDVPATGNNSRAAGLLAEARKNLPQSPEPGVFSVLGVAREGGTDKRPVFTVNAIVPESANAEMFIEGPDGWYPNIPKLAEESGSESVYRVKFSRLGAETPIEGAQFVVLIVSGDRAIEQVVSLD